MIIEAILMFIVQALSAPFEGHLGGKAGTEYVDLRNAKEGAPFP